MKGATMKCVISVLGKDRSGIVAAVAVVLAECGANIDDISQTILNDIFSMTMTEAPFWMADVAADRPAPPAPTTITSAVSSLS